MGHRLGDDLKLQLRLRDIDLFIVSLLMLMIFSNVMLEELLAFL